MVTNDGGLRDDVATDLNGSALAPDPGPQPDLIPERPADGAAKAKWVDYVVALGADRGFVTGDTKHHNSETGESEPSKALSREQLAELADRLGG